MPTKSKSYWWKDKSGKWHYHKPGDKVEKGATSAAQVSSTKPPGAAIKQTEQGLTSAPQNTKSSKNVTHLGTTSARKLRGQMKSPKNTYQYKRGVYNVRHEKGELREKFASRKTKKQALKSISRDQSVGGIFDRRVPAVNRTKAAQTAQGEPPPATSTATATRTPGQAAPKEKKVSYNRASGRLINKRKKGYRP